MEPAVRAASDDGVPLVALGEDTPATKVFNDLAARLASRKRGLAGKKLNLNVR